MDGEARKRQFDMRDLAAIVGIGLITAGTAMFSVAAGLIVCGTLILGGDILAARR